nr:hypothetical protein [Cellulosilyticum ruminicola]
MQKRIAILGSTGSIGTQTLDIVRQDTNMEVVGLSANNNIDLLEAQIKEFRPRLVCVMKEEKAEELRARLSGKEYEIEIVTG